MTTVNEARGGVGRVFTIWVCPECGYYDADPVLRRGPGTRHGVKRCFACGDRAASALDLSRVARSAREWRKSEARKSAPLMVATRMIALPESEDVD